MSASSNLRSELDPGESSGETPGTGAKMSSESESELDVSESELEILTQG
eukprot:CAMPEP_0174263354 /NCGR_PEP_ID=MMETSP0439-20130205/18309_1 /TAXON_ID=0 /ORGANISM="Stereomyxa ramosa, Strain Chinc5" /LENGTH=48 /DNA_ID= /DNA_START= /DNA_END= /DNA_ORIENTATION=